MTRLLAYTQANVDSSAHDSGGDAGVGQLCMADRPDGTAEHPRQRAHVQLLSPPLTQSAPLYGGPCTILGRWSVRPLSLLRGEPLYSRV